NPILEEVAGVTAVTFNSGFDLDAYQSVEPAPDGLVGLDPTRSIEVWAYNPAIANEETLVAWGWRGGPDGSNLSFNYGTNAAFGAVGHWGGPDIGWSDGGGAPEAGRWHHLVYTYDGADTFTTRVYADGCLVGSFCNDEALAPGVINTHAGSPIVLAAQIDNDAGQLNTGLAGTLSLARVRIHDGVLSEEQVQANFEAEQDTYIQDTEPIFVSVPSEGAYTAGAERYQTRIVASGFPPPALEAVAPVGATMTDGLYSYEIPAPEPASFVATVRATNRAGTVEASWTVTRQEAPQGIEVAESLLVSLDAAHPTAGEPVWENQGSMADFEVVGEPIAGPVLGVPVELTSSGLMILDFNGDGGSNIADAVASLNFLFGGGAPPALGEGCAEVEGDCASQCG
ncbi:MAG: LamG domain-containing protein, partial [Actinobacteria bacterium]|nr:LamG domain-containing protein [Actinomycetota bacterium]